MNIEDLNKTQLLLLTILVNFVTSIATGVLTVSLLDETAPTVTQTVNRIVDHTIETVTETQIAVPGTPAPEKPTVSEEQRLTAAIAIASSRNVVIERNKAVLASGVYLPSARAVATLSNSTLPKEVVITFPDGSSAEASKVQSDATVTIYGFSDDAVLPTATVVQTVGYENLKAGQTVVALGSGGNAATGILSKVDETGLYTSLSSIPVGGAAVNLSGNLVGLSTGSGGVFVSADGITSLLNPTPTSSQ
ncbi:hypothetical protein KKH15_00655 [Patescibacteria group bacterium]|nr:hypothetical protein [Patescibacteria group bacterium]MBU1755179.1 hypothetical protein [Patescibacteria group bacterium]